MRQLRHLLRVHFFNEHFDFRVRLFNVLAIAGCIVSIVATIVAFITEEGLPSVLINAAAGVFAYFLLIYASKSGRYERCYIITIVGIFMAAFAVMFFHNAGYRGAVPYFFVFAMVFTVFMLKGKKAFLMLGLEAAFYTALCVIAHNYPETVKVLPNEARSMYEAVFGFLTVGLTLGVTMYLHFRMYDIQQAELEKAREEAIRLSETKSTFLANMSHEIRTPINVILGMNEMVLRESRSEHIMGYGQNIQKAGKTLLTLINNILDFSKIESGKMEVVEESYRTADLIYELTMMGNDCAVKKGIPFRVETYGALPSGLYGGFLHIRQIVFNFINNAFKYTERGSVTLRIGGEAAGEPDEIVLRIAVSDTGTGIREEVIDGLFDAFTRIDLPTHRNIEGTGLGLAIAKELADQMGGSIAVDSVYGEGSEFSLAICQKVSDASPVREYAAAAPEGAQKRGGGFVAPEARILIVDDSRENLMVVRSLLKRTMMRVDMAESGLECIEAVGAHQYHLILMDYMMPDMDGINAFRRLREVYPRFRTPVVALTANAVVGVEQMLLAEGFAAYLSKPVICSELEDTITGLLPDHMVIRDAGIAAVKPVTDADIDGLAAGAAEFGLQLFDGLRYLDGDILHYRHIAGFFAENHGSDVSEVKALLREGDYRQFEHIAHSLKSRAKAVGAQSLHDVAMLLEMKCRTGDNANIESAAELLFLEWERACRGLETLIELIDELIQPASPLRGKADAESLLRAIRVFRYRDAEAEIARMIENAADLEEVERLHTIRKAVESLDFELAESLLSAFCEEVHS